MTARDVAYQFGTLIAQQNFATAVELLTEEAKTIHTPDAMRAAVAAMTGDEPATIRDVQVVEEGIVEDWPGKREGDVAIIYVALNGDSFAEAVSVTVVNYAGNPLIRHLEWGRS